MVAPICAPIAASLAYIIIRDSEISVSGVDVRAARGQWRCNRGWPQPGAIGLLLHHVSVCMIIMIFYVLP